MSHLLFFIKTKLVCLRCDQHIRYGGTSKRACEVELREELMLREPGLESWHGREPVKMEDEEEGFQQGHHCSSH